MYGFATLKIFATYKQYNYIYVGGLCFATLKIFATYKRIDIC